MTGCGITPPAALWSPGQVLLATLLPPSGCGRVLQPLSCPLVAVVGILQLPTCPLMVVVGITAPDLPPDGRGGYYVPQPASSQPWQGTMAPNLLPGTTAPDLPPSGCGGVLHPLTCLLVTVRSITAPDLPPSGCGRSRSGLRR